MSDQLKPEKGLESLIEATVRDQRGEHHFPGRWCKHFEEDRCIERLRDYAETGILCDHKCEYCDKFKWAVDRAKHYAEKTGIPYEEFLKSWEEDRDYWYLNYYQECKQPEIKGDNVRIFDTIADYHESLNQKGFRCPSCGQETSSPFVCHDCEWKSYGLFGCMGKGISVLVKENMALATIFMPVAWEEKDEQ